MTKQNAIKQLHVLRSHMPDGSGLFSEVKDRLSGFIDGVRLDFPPNSRNIIKMYGDYSIVDITLARAPVSSYINKALDVLSFNKWSDLKSKYNFDQMFHLYAILKVQKDNNIVMIRIEKNEVISLTSNFKIEETARLYQLPIMKLITLNELLENAIKMMRPERFFVYSPWHANCQVFLLGLFGASDLLDANA